MSYPPVGAVTFLFTDIQGSTRLWESQPRAMEVALRRHDNLLRATIGEHRGFVFKTVGDSFCAAFANPSDALRAAVALQIALGAEPWPEGVDLRVRLALHRAEATSRDGDYFGPAVNRIARLLDIAHGGQVLLSEAMRDAVGDDLPEGVQVRDQGRHRLRDLSEPEQVFQLLYPQATQDFPPLRSLSTHPNNLPHQVTSFVGRKREIAELRRLLEEKRLLVLLGSGGCGKTRLSLHLAAEVLWRFPEGAWLVELAPVTDPSRVLQTIADVLGVMEVAGEPLQKTVLAYLRARRILLVIDNCEHLITACAPVIDTILRQCPNVSVIASSREVLGITGEVAYRVPSLATPDPRRDVTPAALQDCEAAMLFLERVRLHQPQFVVTATNAPALASVCRRLDGIPLAIELAAARVRTLPIEQIEQRLDQRFRLLTGGSRTALPRQQTLRSLIDWSYNLLDDAEKALLLRLSVFAGGWTLEAAERVCAGEPIEEWEVLDRMTALVDKSLLIFAEETGHYRMLETIREYAREQAAQTDDRSVWADRHAAFFLAFVREASARHDGEDQIDRLHRLEADHDNLHAALDHLLQSGDGVADALRLCAALTPYWETRGFWLEGRSRCESALRACPPDTAPPLQAAVAVCAGTLALNQSDYPAAHEILAHACQRWSHLDDASGTATALTWRGYAEHHLGRFDEARATLRQALAIGGDHGDIRWQATAFEALGNIASVQADIEAAEAHFAKSLEIHRSQGNIRGVAQLLSRLGILMLRKKEFDEARRCFLGTRVQFERLHDRRGLAVALYWLGVIAKEGGDEEEARVAWEECRAIDLEMGVRGGAVLDSLAHLAMRRGDTATALDLWRTSLTERQEIGDMLGCIYLMGSLAMSAHRLDQPERAIRLYAARTARRAEMGLVLLPSDEVEAQQDVLALRARLGDTAETLWAEGQAMTMDRAIAYALGDEDP